MQVDWQFDHMGMIVTDLDKGVAHFRRAGFVPSGQPTESAWPGPSTVVTLREQFLSRDAFALRLQQPVEGTGLPTEFLEKHGEGIHYIGFAVNDLDAASSQMEANGFPVLYGGTLGAGRSTVAYHETCQVADVIVALTSSNTAPTETTTTDATWTFEHAGMVVSDLGDAIKCYEAMGFTLFLPPLNTYAPGKSSDAGLAMCMMTRSGFIIEIMQTFGPRGHEILWGKFLKEHGAGINHIHFAVDNLVEERKRLTNGGFSSITTAIDSSGGITEVYFDTNTVGNVQIALYNGIPRLLYEDTMRYLVDAGILVGRGGLEKTVRVHIETA
ncbi:MAG: hypothetical protein GX604_05740 [Actinobacteria bacterium]|nr:hypothetical protein [Actinomycetota bacterium]